MILQLHVETSETLRRIAAITTAAIAIEYVIIIFAVGVVAVSAVTLVGGDLAAVF